MIGAFKPEIKTALALPEYAHPALVLAIGKPDETVVFSWVIWPDRATRDKAWAEMSAAMDANMGDMPFDGKRMIFGGFEPIVEA